MKFTFTFVLTLLLSASGPADAAGALPAPKPVCASTQAEINKNKDMKKALNGVNVFGLWNGPFGMATIDVKPDGTAVVNNQGKLSSYTIQLCESAQAALFLKIGARSVPFDPKQESIMVSDPNDRSSSPATYPFQRPEQTSTRTSM